jgi:hypothetical protein
MNEVKVEKTKKAVDIFAILNEAEETPIEARRVSNSSNRTTIFKSSLYKKGARTETSLIDETIVEAVKASHVAGKTEVSFYALTRLFEALHYRLKKSDRIASHIQAKEEVFSSFFEVKVDKIVFKDSILIALELETKKPETKLKKANK